MKARPGQTLITPLKGQGPTVWPGAWGRCHGHQLPPVRSCRSQGGIWLSGVSEHHLPNTRKGPVSSKDFKDPGTACTQRATHCSPQLSSALLPASPGSSGSNPKASHPDPPPGLIRTSSKSASLDDEWKETQTAGWNPVAQGPQAPHPSQSSQRGALQRGTEGDR